MSKFRAMDDLPKKKENHRRKKNHHRKSTMRTQPYPPVAHSDLERRLAELVVAEASLIEKLPIRAAVH